MHAMTAIRRLRLRMRLRTRTSMRMSLRAAVARLAPSLRTSVAAVVAAMTMMMTMVPAVAVTVAVAIVAAATVDAATLSVTPLVQSVSQGSTADVALTIAGLGDATAPSLGVFDLDLGFDATLLDLTGVDFGDPVAGDQLDLTGLGSLNFATPGANTVNLFELSFDPIDALNALQADHFTLAVLHFSARAAGTSALHLTVNALGDAAGAALPATITDGAISVEGAGPIPTPEPGSIVLVTSGLAGLLGYARVRRDSLRLRHDTM
jgi:hypothetical protein